MHLDPLALGISSLVVVALAAVAFLLSRDRGRETIAERLAEPEADAFAPAVALVEERSRSATFLARLAARVARVAMPVNEQEVRRLSERLQQGGLRGEQTVTTFLGAKVLLAGSGLAAFLWFTSRGTTGLEPGMFGAVMAFAAGFYLPDGWLISRTRSRQTSIERGLPDALDLLVTCVEAGLGLDSSVQRVADEVMLAWPVLGRELRTTFLEVKAGIPRIQAFRRLAARTGVRDLKSLAATLTQTETFGTSVASALRIQAEGIRVRRMQRAEEKAAYVSVKMTLPLIACILPSLFAIIMGPAALSVMNNLLPMLGRR